MGRRIAEEFSAARTLYDQASDILNYDLAKLCFEGPAEELDSTIVSQPALFVTSLACLEKLRDRQPDVVLACEMTAGLSLGEYTALVFAGAMSFEDGLRVVQQRGQAMQQAADETPSGMVSVLLLWSGTGPAGSGTRRRPTGRLRSPITSVPETSCFPGKTQPAKRRSLSPKPPEGNRSRSPSPARFTPTSCGRPTSGWPKRSQGVQVAAPGIPVVSNVDAAVHENPSDIKDILVRQVLNPVRWEDSIRFMIDSGVDEFYEIGPGKVLTGLLKRVNRKIPCTPVNDAS